MAKFGLANWLVLIVYFLVILLIGKFSGKSSTQDTESYTLGTRKIPWWAIGLSVMAAQCSAVAFIGMPGWGYTSGLARLTYNFQFPLVVVIVMSTFVPFFYNTKVVSAYEYLEKRFGKKSRSLMAAIFLVSRGLQTAVVLYAPSLALSMITGMNPKTAILCMGVLSIIYTLVGGIMGVIWTDVVQMGVIWVGILLAVIIPIFRVDGGLSAILANASANNLLQGMDYSFSLENPYTFWGGLLGGGFLYLTYIGTDQSQVQKVLTAKSISETKLSLSLTGFLMPIQTLLFLLAGIFLFSAFDGRTFENSDYVMLTFITDYLPAGLGGLVTAGVFAAGLSSINAALNALSTVTLNDFYKKWKPDETDKHYLNFSKGMNIFWGVFSCVFALLLGGLGTVLELINVIGPLFYPCMLSAFVLAVFCKKGTEKGCIAAVLTGLAVDFYMFKFTDIGSLWWCFFGFLAAFAVGYIVSLMTYKEEVHSLNQAFSYETATGNQLTIENVVKLAVAGEIETKDADGYYVIPGKIDKIGYALIAFFIIQCILLSII